MSNKTVLITGASSGIGLELAKIHAAEGDNLILVARNQPALDELKRDLENRCGIAVQVITKDLSVPDSTQEIFDETNRLGLHVDFLINNAGFGDYGLFHESDWSKDLQMINLNMTALTQLCRLYLPAMIERGSGRIMNVASTAAFQPGPLMAIYFATKAYVLHFSEALGNEVQDKGVTVTALCPGATTSGFQAAAGMEESRLVQGRNMPSSLDVAEYGYRAMMQGKTVAIHGVMNSLMANSVRMTPRSLVVKLVRKIQDRAD